jgi:GntR family transcriptional regulator of arabinose operon
METSTKHPETGIDLKTRLPIYRQIEAKLRRQIETGELRPGQPLPSNRLLCEQFGGVNHLTVRQALKQLSAANLVRSVHGKGTFVAHAPLRHNRIGIILPNLDETLTMQIVEGVQRYLASQSVRALILDSRRDFDNEIDNMRQLSELPIDGALIFPSPDSYITEQVVTIKQAGFPFVLIDRFFTDVRTSCVVADNYRGAYDVTQHVVSRGKRSVAWVGELNSTTASERFEGFRDALGDAGIVLNRSNIFELRLSNLSSAARLQEEVNLIGDRIFSRADAIDGAICINDNTALFLMERLRALGLAIPRDIAVTGFDDLPQACTSLPPLTTVRQEMETMGEQAAMLLMERIQDPSSPVRKITLPVRLVVRESA